MSRYLAWLLVTVNSLVNVYAQCEEEARLLQVGERAHLLATARAQQAEAAVSQYEPLAEMQPALEPLLAAARDIRDQANKTLAEAESDLTSAQGSLSGCEEEAAKQKEEEERILLESIPKLDLTITYFGPVESDAFSREEARRWAAANDLLQPTIVTTPIEVSVPAKAGFSYELLQSSDLITWQTQAAAAYLSEDKLLAWQITPTNGSRTRDAAVKDREPTAIPYFRLSISPGDTTQSGGGRTRGDR